ncbi:hypothetical protein JZ751_029777 [Albula glossodonta]|uniref:Uncharacterized protein n=1 Tax=Albula glossodonta TaxID=121402 RepID=A0A8T2N9X5_9TELE|nr:hypothetical protein JZ751_029777 [Albula glossodonta]
MLQLEEGRAQNGPRVRYVLDMCLPSSEVVFGAKRCHGEGWPPMVVTEAADGATQMVQICPLPDATGF